MAKGRKRIPVEVQESTRGKPHRSNAELEGRKANEERINSNLPDAEAPAYLTTKEKRERFANIVAMMKLAGPKTLAKCMDADAIAAYVDAQMNYEHLQKKLDSLMRKKDASIRDIDELSRMRNAAQTQCDKLRSVLALDPISRLKVEAEPEEPKKNKFADFQ